MRFPQKTTLIVLTASLWGSISSCSPNAAIASDEQAAVGQESDPDAPEASPSERSVTVSKKWSMPPELTEISGISWMDDQRIACVQDERGSLFIYNLGTSRVEREIPFAGPGDYEAVSKAGNRFYVMRADGYIYELDPAAKNPVLREMDMGWSGKHDIEAMSYDVSRKRLLVTDKMDASGRKRSVYAFDPATGKMNTAPVLQVDLGAAADDEKGSGKKKGGKKKDDKKGNKNATQFASMATHPQTGDIYFTDGGESTLIVVNKTGRLKHFVKLDKGTFPQPEGITISSKGIVYISSEGGKGEGVIARISL